MAIFLKKILVSSFLLVVYGCHPKGSGTIKVPKSGGLNEDSAAKANPPAGGAGSSNRGSGSTSSTTGSTGTSNTTGGSGGTQGGSGTGTGSTTVGGSRTGSTGTSSTTGGSGGTQGGSATGTGSTTVGGNRTGSTGTSSTTGGSGGTQGGNGNQGGGDGQGDRDGQDDRNANGGTNTDETDSELTDSELQDFNNKLTGWQEQLMSNTSKIQEKIPKIKHLRNHSNIQKLKPETWELIKSLVQTLSEFERNIIDRLANYRDKKKSQVLQSLKIFEPTCKNLETLCNKLDIIINRYPDDDGNQRAYISHCRSWVNQVSSLYKEMNGITNSKIGKCSLKCVKTLMNTSLYPLKSVNII